LRDQLTEYARERGFVPAADAAEATS